MVESGRIQKYWMEGYVLYVQVSHQSLLPRAVRKSRRRALMIEGGESPQIVVAFLEAPVHTHRADRTQEAGDSNLCKPRKKIIFLKTMSFFEK